MTLKQLRAAVTTIGHEHDDREVEVWLPGSYIRLEPSLWISGRGSVLIEGNLKPGAALGVDNPWGGQ